MQALMCIQGPVDEDDEWSEDDYDGNVGDLGEGERNEQDTEQEE